MSKPKVKIVIGANYGDEGKGLATDYFTQKAKGPVLNVLYNGGPQRGHTVEHRNGLRHIFHHFGSGFFSGASTYFDENFLVDPIKFNIEHCELLDQAKYFTDMTEKEARNRAICYIHPECKVITPWAAMANQILAKRTEKHDTCGCGIWMTEKFYRGDIETIPGSLRPLYFKELTSLNDDGLQVYLMSLALNWFYWLAKQITGKSFYQLSEEEQRNKSFLGEYADIFLDPSLRSHFMYDIQQMKKRVLITELKDIAPSYETIIFEGGQGLALNRNNILRCSFSTPSFTGSLNPISSLHDISENYQITDAEICYVTRTYFTKHGYGPLPNECKKEDLGDISIDLTNQPNKFQGELRYAYFNWQDLLYRINEDFRRFTVLYSSEVVKTLMITHYDSKRFDFDASNAVKFNDCYISSSPYSEEVEVWQS